MSFTNFQKTIALTSGVLVLSVAIALVVIAVWTGPSADPPLNNAPFPINVSNIDQTKTGGLTIKELSLEDGTGKGDIINADDITGGNDLFLHSKTNQTEILLDEDGGEGIKFYTNSAETMVVGDDGNVYISNLNSCDTIDTDASGKLVCGVDKGDGDFGPIHRDTFFWDILQDLGPEEWICEYFVLPVDLNDFDVAVISVIVPKIEVYPQKDFLYYGYEVLSQGNNRVIRAYVENISSNVTVPLSIRNTPWTILYIKEP